MTSWDPLASVYARADARARLTDAERNAALAADMALLAAIGARAANLLPPAADPLLGADLEAWDTPATAPGEDDTLCDLMEDLS